MRRVLCAAVVLLSIAPSARAQSSGPRELQLWSNTAVQVLPDLYGVSGVRAIERLGVDATFEDGWSVAADGALRVLRSPYEPLEVDLYRLAATHRGDAHRFTIGRHVRLDARGFERLDGVSIDIVRPSAINASLWGGRLWHPVTWHSGTTMVLGTQVTFNPLVDGAPSKLTQFAAGYELRAYDEGHAHRMHLAASTRTPTGMSGFAFIEVEPRAREGLRASLRGNAPLGRTVDVGLELKWEDLRPDAWPQEVRAPITWLAPDGYGMGTFSARWASGPWALSASGGPSLAPRGGDLSVGALGRGGLSWRAPRNVTVGAFATGVAIDGSWVGGGGGELGWHSPYLIADADLGLYRFQGIDGAARDVWEGRVEGRVPVWEKERNGLSQTVTVGVNGAVGADRQLASWVRGGVSLQVHAGRGGSR